jgi:hypothetical protein
MADRRGVAHHYTLEQLQAFRAISPADKLRWLGEMKDLLEKTLSPERLEILQRFRRGDL